MNDVLRLASDNQRRATSPDQSAWVEANAGTGKTKVLTDRVTRLLLAGVKPERILCLTFTKAAAAEMRNRLSSQLGRWAMAPDKELDQELERLIDEPPEPGQRVIARRLFARVLDAPGGINILTIHAFCQALLKRFPLEAGVAPGFEVMDEADARALLQAAQDEQIEALAAPGAPPPLADALATVSRKVSIAEYAELMGALLGERAWLLSRIGSDDGLEKVRRLLARRLNCTKIPAIDEASLRKAARALVDAGGKTDPPRGDAIAAWLDAGPDRPPLAEDYLGAFFTDSGQLRKSLATKAAIKLLPGIEDILLREAERLDGQRGQALVDLTVALLRLGLDITGRYARAKRQRAALDYDDLIVATRRLLEGGESAGWVLYKLDGGIDHVLVDEAQDTNPDQWEVIRNLTGEFFAGTGAVDRLRTIFAVGDTKQSIFGFQRADPRKLSEMRNWFETKSIEADRGFTPVDLTVSFRSTPAVLDAVDRVLQHDPAARGVAQPGAVEHLAARTNQPGIVEVWPLCVTEKAEVDTTDLDAPASLQRLPHVRLARLIARHARSLIGTERRARDGELLNAGHFMVLVRRRNEFVNALVRELKQARIEVAGVDRLNLGEELAIQDLLALARFVLLPQDDLNLAALLKSPLVGLNEEQLFTLAYKRTGHLWRALREKAREPAFAFAHERLSAWLRRADLVTPFDFFAQALGPEGGRKALLERLGREASDPIDELLARALQYQRAEGGSLQGFLRWFEMGGGEIKRDLDANRRPEVRILTVHASKGLQAPIVYLPDTTRTPQDTNRLIEDEDGDARLWLPRSADANESARAWRAAAKERSLEEQNRLLYVAMTRAEDRLYVGGWIGQRKQDSHCWYERIAGGLAESGLAPTEFDFADLMGDEGWKGPGFRLLNEGQLEEPDQAPLALPDNAELPDWIGRDGPDEPDPPAPLAPSQPLADESAAPARVLSPLGADNARRWQRGQLIHELLRHLPSLPPDGRGAAARHFLGQAAHGLTAGEIEDWTREALRIVEDERHAALFGPESRAEVPLTGTIETPRGTFTVSGQVDRLAVGTNEILIVDFKTNRPPPSEANIVPLAYRRQLALYRALLQRIYPGRKVRAFLLWTATPLLMEIDGKTLDNSMPYASPS